jgi:hypothetical protein
MVIRLIVSNSGSLTPDFLTLSMLEIALEVSRGFVAQAERQTLNKMVH